MGKSITKVGMDYARLWYFDRVDDEKGRKTVTVTVREQEPREQ